MMESLYGPVAGLDVHKKTVVVVLLQSVQPDQDYASGIFGATQFGPKELVTFLRQHGVTHAAMDPRLSIGGRCGWHWKGEFTLTLAQAALHASAARPEVGQGRCPANCEATVVRPD
jgi:hypothetical protein